MYFSFTTCSTLVSYKLQLLLAAFKLGGSLSLSSIEQYILRTRKILQTLFKPSIIRKYIFQPSGGSWDNAAYPFGDWGNRSGGCDSSTSAVSFKFLGSKFTSGSFFLGGHICPSNFFTSVLFQIGQRISQQNVSRHLLSPSRLRYHSFYFPKCASRHGKAYAALQCRAVYFGGQQVTNKTSALVVLRSCREERCIRRHFPE